MAETSVLAELMFEVAPHWNGRLEKYIKESDSEDSQKQNAGIILTPSGLPAPKIVEPACDGSSTRRIVSTPGVAGVAMPAPSPTNLTPPAEPSSDNANAAENTQAKQNTPANHGACRLDSKPDPKSRFSSLTSPVVMYDGESQQMLCDMWTALNNRRGGLRKEMMAVKRRQQLAAAPPPRIMPEIAMDSDGEGSDKDDEDVEHNAEMLRLRLKIEREKMKRMVRRGPPGGPIAAGGTGADMGGAAAALGGLQFKRARMMGGAGGPPSQAAPTGASAEDEKMVKLLEAVDDNLDKACRVTETVAFLWLKGDPYAPHLKFIMGRLKDIEEKIEKSGLVPPKKKEDSEASKKKEEVKVQELVTVMAPPPHLTPRKTSSPRLEISKKKSDLTMRDAPSLKLVQVQVPQPLPSPPLEKQIRRKKSGSSSEDTVGPSMESVNPPLVLVTIPAGGSNKHGSGVDLKTNPFFTKPGVLEVDVEEDSDDTDTDSADEGILC